MPTDRVKRRRPIRIRKTKNRGIKFLGLKIKDECFRRLTERSSALAEAARIDGTLEDLNGKLHCECGATVGARKTNMGYYLVPTRHPVYKEPRQPARKRACGGKRT